MMTIAVRYPILFFFKITRLSEHLWERAVYTAIGFSGHVSELDKGVAKERKLKPLNRFERWLLKPFIKSEQEMRREAWRQALKAVTGEDMAETDY